MTRNIVTALIILAVAGCAGDKTQAIADFNVAYNVAAAAEAAYAAQPHADQHAVSDMAHLLSSAQAALITWQTSNNPADLTAVNAAIAALVAYEAAVSAGRAPAAITVAH